MVQYLIESKRATNHTSPRYLYIAGIVFFLGRRPHDKSLLALTNEREDFRQGWKLASETGGRPFGPERRRSSNACPGLAQGKDVLWVQNIAVLVYFSPFRSECELD